MRRLDLFADGLYQLYRTGNVTLSIERDDGQRTTEDLSWYLTTYPSFPLYEKRALKFARGRVLDVGCGAGRHSLYLQKKGLRVTAIDASPRVATIASARGVRDVRVASACAPLPFRDGEFDTVLMFGNNLGICGSPVKFRRMLRQLHRITSSRGRILATTRAPDTSNPVARAYLERNIKQRRAVGQMRLRLEFEHRHGAWFDLLLLAPTDLMQLAWQEGWKLAQLFAGPNLELGYAVVLEKT